MAFRGLTARMPMGLRGWTGSKNPTRIEAIQLIDAEGVTYEADAVQKEPGRVKYNATPITGAPKILAMHDWWVGAQQFLVVVTSDGKILRDAGTGTFPTTLKSGLLTDRVTRIAEGGAESAGRDRKLFFYNGGDVVQVLAGTGVTASNITTPPADWSGANQPRFGIPHNGRMWAGGNDNDPHRVYYSTAADHENYTGAGSGSISVFPGEGERLVGGISWNGRLFLLKFPRGVYWINDSSLTASDWGAKRLTGSVGLASPWGIVALESDVIFQSSDALLYLLSAVEALGDAKPRSAVDDVDLDVWIRDNLSFGRLDRAHLVWHPTKRQVILAAAGVGASKNNVRMVADVKHAEARWSYSRRDVVESLITRLNSARVAELISGDDAGTVFRHDQAERANAGSAYKGSFQLNHMDFSWLNAALSDIRKKFEHVRVVMAPQGNYNVSIDVLIDGTYRETIIMNLGDVGSTLGTFVLDTDRLGGTAILNRKKRLHGTGYRISLIVYNTGLGQSFSISEITIPFVPASDRALRGQ